MLPADRTLQEMAAGLRDAQRRIERLETLEGAGGTGGGCLKLIEDVVLTMPTNSFSFGIPQTFKHLWLWTDLIHAAFPAGETAYLTLNGDEGANYTWVRMDLGQGANNHFGSGGDSADTKIDLRANIYGGHHEINIVNYRSATNKKNVLWKGGGGTYFWPGDPGPVTIDVVVIGRGMWHSNVPVTSLDIKGTTNYIAGSRCTLYGLC